MTKLQQAREYALTRVGWRFLNDAQGWINDVTGEKHSMNPAWQTGRFTLEFCTQLPITDKKKYVIELLKTLDDYSEHNWGDFMESLKDDNSAFEALVEFLDIPIPNRLIAYERSGQ